MKRLFFLFVLIIFLGCKKDKISLTSDKEIVGWYEWVHSSNYDGTLESESQETTSEKFAFAIKRNGNVVVFRDGKKVNKGYVTKYDDDINYNKIRVHFDELTTGVVENLIDETLIVKDYPIENSMNEFIKL